MLRRGTPSSSARPRTDGCETSQRRNGRFVTTPSTSVSASAARSRSSASPRVGAVRDQLRDHRVVGEADLVALLDAGVDAHAGRAAAAARRGRPAGRTCAGPRRRAAPRPRGRGAAAASPSAPPAAIRSCSATRSRPVTSSVTGCSTWMRPFSSSSQKSPPSSTNSTVPGAAVPDRARERDRRLAHPPRAAARRARATAPPRAPSGGAAGSSTRARRAPARCRARPRAPGSRRGAAARGSAPRRRVSSPKPAFASRRAASSDSSSSAGSRTTRIPRPPPPAAALSTSGKPTSSGSPASSTGTPASRAIRFASSLSPPSRSASGVGPTKTSPAASTASAKLGLSARNP